ncbi:MAG: hypothetical protein K9H65_05885 [Bacteroidales bacterium]|nr:hypothetical protein [Bacteroidales bacterium]
MFTIPAAILFLIVFSLSSVSAQPVVMAWGNLNGIRVEGQLMEFKSSFRIVEKDWGSITATEKEGQPTEYHREGKMQTVSLELDGFEFSEKVRENGRGSAIVSVNATATKDTLVEGVFFCVELPGEYYSHATGRFEKGSASGKTIAFSEVQAGAEPIKISAQSVSIEASKRQLDIVFASQAPVFLRKEAGTSGYQVYIGLLESNIREGQKAHNEFTFRANGSIDRSPVEITIDADKPGRRFAGMGGNFRLQKPDKDPQVIQYCLDSMRVAWGRVEMPWQLWHPDEDTDPIEAAENGNLDPHVHESMLMAQKLAKRGIPVIVSDWQAPEWAIVGEHEDAYRYRDQGIFGYPLDQDKMEKIYQSIGDYLVYMKQHYGVEPVMFSFNESDLGIDVRQTAEEHAEFIKGFGAHLASRDLATKLLLGDNSDATTFDFILPAMNDPKTHKYIGAVSFHSWRGCSDKNLKKWAGAADKLNVPLIIGEGSTDAAAWKYPEIFYEQSFAMYEINLYTRILEMCEPLSILQWQLTADYSVMKGIGIYDTKGPLRPTQRFWNLKQLASTPEDAFSLPVNWDEEELNCAAFGNIARGEYAVHIVNNGAERQAAIKGLPEEGSTWEVFITNQDKGMKKTGEVTVNKGSVELNLPPVTFVTLISK